MLGSVNGKKTVIYFATDVERTDSVELQPLIVAAIRANVSFYSVDSRGLIQNPPVDARQQQVDAALQKLQEHLRRTAFVRTALFRDTGPSPPTLNPRHRSHA
jgi:hypothetical protein